MIMKRQTIHIVAGPTASGKSSKALTLALERDGVIINCDSLQIYDGLPLLTAQPCEEDKVAIPHELYGVLHPNEVCSAGAWRELVEPVIHDVLASGRTPIITGGSGLYIKALTEGLSPIPPIPDEVRKQTVRLQEEMGAEAFYEALKIRDPVMAERFHSNHSARLRRAWEVLEATGRSLAQWQKEPLLAPPAYWDFKMHLISPERVVLYERCNTRFLQMLDEGALEEVKDFSQAIERGEVEVGVPLEKALGFKSLRSYLYGEISLEEAIERSQGETRRYAKRQTTWFKNQV